MNTLRKGENHCGGNLEKSFGGIILSLCEEAGMHLRAFIKRQYSKFRRKQKRNIRVSLTKSQGILRRR